MLGSCPRRSLWSQYAHQRTRLLLCRKHPTVNTLNYDTLCNSNGVRLDRCAKVARGEEFSRFNLQKHTGISFCKDRERREQMLFRLRFGSCSKNTDYRHWKLKSTTSHPWLLNAFHCEPLMSFHLTYFRNRIPNTLL